MRTNRRNRTALAGATLLLAAGTTVGSAAVATAASRPSASSIALAPGSGAAVADWNQALLSIQKTPGAQPATVHPTRALAMLHVAMYDAVASITGRDQPYLFVLHASRTARPDAAADQAAHDVLVGLYPTMQPLLDQQLADELGALPTGADTDAGERVGHLAASFILAARSDDGATNVPPPFTLPPASPGAYQPTPPNNPEPAFTGWGHVDPFVLDTADEFRPPAPPALDSKAWADTITEVEQLGQDTSTTRTDEQTAIGRFWAAPIWTTWNQIAESQVTGRRTNLEVATKVFSTMNLAIADTTVAMYDAKYTYNLWRPITAIRAGTPGNPGVTADPTWNALTTTAADPSYPGAHSSISATAATVLANAFGPRADITVTNDSLPGTTRHFRSFQDAATEAGLSRIYAGQHTRVDHEAGVTLGTKVARLVLNRIASGAV
jgi:membrane-associated phospholipid phosphatase